MRRRGRVRGDATRGRNRVSGGRRGLRRADAAGPQPVVDRLWEGRAGPSRPGAPPRIGTAGGGVTPGVPRAPVLRRPLLRAAPPIRRVSPPTRPPRGGSPAPPA